MIDPAAIGTTIIWLEAQRRREADVEQYGPVGPIEQRGFFRGIGRRLRSLADRLDPAPSTLARPGRSKP